MNELKVNETNKNFKLKAQEIAGVRLRPKPT